MQIKVLHGFNEKGEQELIAKQPQNPPINTPPLKLGFWLKKKRKLAKLWSNFSRKSDQENPRKNKKKYSKPKDLCG